MRLDIPGNYNPTLDFYSTVEGVIYSHLRAHSYCRLWLAGKYSPFNELYLLAVVKDAVLAYVDADLWEGIRHLNIGSIIFDPAKLGYVLYFYEHDEQKVKELVEEAYC